MSITAPTPDELEQLAIRHRASSGMMPYDLWAGISADARERLGRLTQREARRILTADKTLGPGEVEIDVDVDEHDQAPAIGRQRTSEMDEVALAALVEQTGTGGPRKVRR